MPELKKGDKVPAFEALDQDGKALRLADFHGSPLFIFFYPKANTSG